MLVQATRSLRDRRRRDEHRKMCIRDRLCTAPYFALYPDPMWLAFAEDAAIGPSISAFRTAARNHHIIVIAPIFETDARSGKRFNTAVVIDENGEILGLSLIHI